MDDMNGIVLRRGEAPFDFYPYNPNGIAGWVFLALFSIVTIVHLAFSIRYRVLFTIPFVLGCIAQAGGYYGRAAAHNNIRGSGPYLLQLFLIISGTPIMSATIYMSLPRLARALTMGQRRMRWISRSYIVLDIVCLVLQIMGTVMAAYGSEKDKGNAPKYIASGLVFQLAAFILFMVLAGRLHKSLLRQPTQILRDAGMPRWQLCFWGLYITSSLVLIRNLVRIIEFVQGAGSPILANEVFLYFFDATPMFLVAVVFGLFHPGKVMRHASKFVDDPLLLTTRDSATVLSSSYRS